MVKIIFYCAITVFFLISFFGNKEEYSKKKDKITLLEMAGSIMIVVSGVLIVVSSILEMR